MTQYEQQTRSEPSPFPPSFTTQFHEAHAARRRGIRLWSVCSQTSFEVYWMASRAAASAGVASAPRSERVTSVCCICGVGG